MVYLAVALVAVAALCALDLMLTLAVLRRLRDSPAGPAAPAAAEPGIPVGAAVDAFTTSCAEGTPLTERDLTDGAVVAFFSPGCPPCRRALPTFVKRAARPRGRQMIAVVVTPAGNAAEEAEARTMAEQLAPVARVVHEDPEGPCTTAFGVHGFPTQFAISAPAGAPPTVAAVGDTVLTALPVGSA
ncbi:redoxin domain-containing protein [Streptomyces sp. NPDC006645]|uniref:TlpA family protein disulfide reductase n=1 Tax=unclassified Streptomyces TaxID=2593676 RepID=UPI0033AE39F1